jgi:hypothetical protein
MSGKCAVSRARRNVDDEECSYSPVISVRKSHWSPNEKLGRFSSYRHRLPHLIPYLLNHCSREPPERARDSQ